MAHQIQNRVKRRWRIEGTLQDGVEWHVYLVQEILSLDQALMIQRIVGPTVALARSKHNFLQYCVDRNSYARWPLPKALDRFTDGNSLLLVEALPDNSWSNLRASGPPNPIAWTSAFFEGLDLIGAHGNPNLETIYWRDSQVLFCRTTFPHVCGGPAQDDPAGIRQVVEAAFRQDLPVILDRDDLDDELRSRLDGLARVTVDGYAGAQKSKEQSENFAASIAEATSRKQQAKNREQTRKFNEAFANCCRGLGSPPSLGAQRQLLEQFVSNCPSRGADSDAWRKWMESWQQIALLSCELIADTMDGGSDNTMQSQAAQNAYHELIRLAKLQEIQPQIQGMVSIPEHRIVESIPASAADKPGSIAHVQKRGFRREGQVLRKAEVVVFGEPLRRVLPWGWLAAAFASFILLTSLAGWWWMHRSAAQTPPSNQQRAVTEPAQQNKPSANGEITLPTPPGPSKATQPERVEIRYFTLSRQEVKAGETVTMSWDVAHAPAVHITGIGTEPMVLPPAGTRNIIVPANTEQVVLEAQGQGNGNSASAVRQLHVLPSATSDTTVAASTPPAPAPSVVPHAAVRPWEPERPSEPVIHVEPTGPIRSTAEPAEKTPVKPEEKPASEAVQPAAGLSSGPAAGYSGPHEGHLLWKGEIEKNGIVTINGNSASPGSLDGELPGVPVDIDLDTKNFAMVEQPSRDNGWRRMQIRSKNKQHAIILKWEVRR